MRRMAGHTAFGLDRRVLKSKWTGLVGVTSKANRILGRRSAQLVSPEAAMRVVTIAAGNQSFVNPMMKGLGEVRLDLEVAGIAKPRLRRLQQGRLHRGRVNRVAVDASHVVLDMLGAQEVRVLLP